MPGYGKLTSAAAEQHACGTCAQDKIEELQSKLSALQAQRSQMVSRSHMLASALQVRVASMHMHEVKGVISLDSSAEAAHGLSVVWSAAVTGPHGSVSCASRAALLARAWSRAPDEPVLAHARSCGRRSCGSCASGRRPRWTLTRRTWRASSAAP